MSSPARRFVGLAKGCGMARLERAETAVGLALVASGVLLLCLAASQVPLEGAPVELAGPSTLGYAGWSGSAAIAARTQQLADEVDGGDQAANDTPTDDVDGANSPITMTVTSPAIATSVTTAQVVPTVQEEMDKLEGVVTATEDKQLDEESTMKTFKEKQLDKIEELKEKNARLKRRCVSKLCSLLRHGKRMRLLSLAWPLTFHTFRLPHPWPCWLCRLDLT